MGEGRKIAARAHRSAAGHMGMHLPVQEGDQALERLAADAGEPFREDIRAQRHGGAYGPDGQRFTNTRGMAPEEVHLELIDRFARNRGFSERAEPRVDAVNGLVAPCLRLDYGSRPIDAGRCIGVQHDSFARVCDRNELAERQ